MSYRKLKKKYGRRFGTVFLIKYFSKDTTKRRSLYKLSKRATAKMMKRCLRENKTFLHLVYEKNEVGQ